MLKIVPLVNKRNTINVDYKKLNNFWPTLVCILASFIAILT